MSQRLKDIGEFGLIRLLARMISRRKGVILGIGDDAAVLRAGKDDILFTTDMLIEDVHFKRNAKPELIGRKAMASNLSDIAAMGGTPDFAVISLGVPPDLPVNFVKRMYSGLSDVAGQFHVGIVGGDTVKSRKIIIAVALLGRIGKGKAVLRSGAREGDRIFLSGSVGGSSLKNKHLAFTPRIREAQFLVRNYRPCSMIDVSDGLVADLGHILEQSRVGAVIETDRIPRSRGVSLQSALTEGEDFELLFTLNLRDARRLLNSRSDFRFYEIGHIVPQKKGLRLINHDGKRIKIREGGFRHF